MIRLEHVTKTTRIAGQTKSILSSVSLDIPTDRRIALLGPSNANKRLLIDILAGVEMPTSGHVVRGANVSFPVGDLPGFSRELTIRINVAHVARLYAADVKRTLNLVESVLDIGGQFDRPYENLPRVMRKRLAQAVAFSLPFDVYLLSDDRLAREWAGEKASRDEEPSGGRISELFGARLRKAGMIIPTDDIAFARSHFEIGLFLHRGELTLAEDMRAPFQLLMQRRKLARQTAAGRTRGERRRGRKVSAAD